MSTSPFASFWQAGYEGADHVDGAGRAVAMNAATAHDAECAADYARLAAFDIRSVRESVGWRTSECDGRFDFTQSERRARAAHAAGIQIAWTLCHYGMPADLVPRDEAFVRRFAAFCREAARALLPWQIGTPVFTLVNEISFLTWALESTQLMPAPCRDAWLLKRTFVAATLAGMAAIRELAPHARFMHVDPVIHVAPPVGREDLQPRCAAEIAAQYQAWDMIAGRLAPELGGCADALDVIGVNYYHSNQWETGTEARLHWHARDPRRRAFADLLEDVWRRYRRPIAISETSHVGAGRGDWLLEVAGEVARARARGVPILAVCLYPIVDRPDWNDARHWHKSGLWDLRFTPDADGTPRPRRVLDMLYAADLRRAQAHFDRRRSRLTPRTRDPHMLPIVVYSHLRWNFVFQRPQHLMVRLAEHHPIVFVEEPVFDPGPPTLLAATPAPNVHVLTPRTPIAAPGFDAAQRPVVHALLADYAARHALEDVIAWFYTPMALDLVDAIPPRTVVFDCMDHLAGFKGAPPGIAERESALLRRADVVFTGGRSLYRAKSRQAWNVHCFPSSVEAAHFGRARDRRLADPALASLRRPRLGFFGVIDERLDVPLVAALAAARPEWELVFVGPVVKIDPATLPRGPNLHWLGQQPYEALPGFLAGWDVCLMPFALNEATRFISPTKTLEYMAAELPVVSTPIVDVVEPYAGIVEIADGPEAFAAACERVLCEDATARGARVARMRAAVAATSWDTTVAAMREIIADVPARVRLPAAAAVEGVGAAEVAKVNVAAKTAWSTPARRLSAAVIVDAHVHCSGRERQDEVLRAFDGADVDVAVLLAPFLTPPYALADEASLRRANDHLARLVAGRRDRLRGFAVVNPLQRGALAECRRALDDLGLDGVKLVPSGWFPHEEHVAPLFELVAARRRPVLLHTGIFIDGVSGRYCRPVDCEALRRHAGLKVTLAHLGWPWCDEAIAVGLIDRLNGVPADDSVFRFDLSFGAPPVYRREVLSRALEVLGPELLQFGSDCFLPCEAAELRARRAALTDLFAALDVAPEARARMLAGTALAWLGETPP